MIRKQTLSGLCLLALLAASMLVTPLRAQTTGVSMIVTVGWNLLAGHGNAIPINGPYYTYQPGDSDYEIVDSNLPLRSGLSYWVYSLRSVAITLPTGSAAPLSVTPPAGQWVLIGNPSGTRTALVAGADAVYTFNLVDGYRQTTTLQPGQGAWAVSTSGGTITVSPDEPVLAAPNFRVVSAASGYRFQVPNTWTPVPGAILASVGAGGFNIDSVYASSDGRLAVFTATEQEPGLTLEQLPDAVQAYFDGFGSSLGSVGASPATIFQGPQAVSVANADGAMTGSASYTDGDGTERVSTVIIALRGQSALVLIMVVTRDFFNQNPAYATITGSFQLAP